MTWPTYNQDDLITDVQNLLTERGIEVQLTAEGEPLRRQGAASLLSGFSITPTLSPERALRLDGGQSFDTRVHSD
jgi:hypothetical protein